MIIYLIKSSLCLAAFLLVYNLVFERENMHVFKRFYLLTSLVFSFVVPFISFEFQAENIIVATSNTVQSIVLPDLELTSTSNNLPDILYSIYGIITLFFAFRFFRNLATIYKSRRNAELIPYENAIIALVEEPILPHTFGSTISLISYRIILILSKLNY